VAYAEVREKYFLVEDPDLHLVLRVGVNVNIAVPALFAEQRANPMLDAHYLSTSIWSPAGPSFWM
jgi:hypothetical protein